MEEIKNRLEQNLLFLKNLNNAFFEELMEYKSWDKPIQFVETESDIDLIYYEERIENLQFHSQEHAKLFFENVEVFYYTSDCELCNMINEELEEHKSHMVHTADELIIVGLLPFFHIRQIFEKIKNDKGYSHIKTIRLIEQNPDLLFLFLMVEDLKELINFFGKSVAVHLALAPTENKIKKIFLDFFDRLQKQKIIGLVYKSYASENMRRIIKEARELNLINKIALKPIYFTLAVENMYENLMNKNTNYLTKNNQFISHAKPFLLIGSAPSLDQELAWLKENITKFHTITLSSALKILYKNEIVPDAVAIVDPLVGKKEGTIHEFEGIKEEWLAKITCFASIESDSILLKSMGKTIVFTSSSDFKFLDGFFSLMPSPTVTSFVVDLLLQLGAKELYLLGVDLGTKSLSQAYAKDYGDYTWEHYVREPFEGNFGGEIYTRTDYLITKKALEIVAKRYSGRKLFNLSDGIKIEGFLPLRTNEISLQKFNEGFVDFIDQLRLKKTIEIDKELLQQEIGSFQRVLKQLANIEKALQNKKSKKLHTYLESLMQIRTKEGYLGKIGFRSVESLKVLESLFIYTKMFQKIFSKQIWIKMFFQKIQEDKEKIREVYELLKKIL